MEAYLALLFCNQTRFSASVCINETAPSAEILQLEPDFGGFHFCPNNLIEWWIWLVK